MSLADREGRAEATDPSAHPTRSLQLLLAAARARVPRRSPPRARLIALSIAAVVTGLVGLGEVLTPAPHPPVPGPETADARSPLKASAFPARPDADPALVLKFKPLTPAEAYLANAAIPASSLPDPAAAPLVLHDVAGAIPADAATCLAQAVYYEAASESLDGQRAVAQVVLNRVRDARYPHNVCGVVFQGSGRSTGCQFSFTCDGSMVRPPSPAGWARARSVAEDALDGYVMAAVGGATHYHTVWVTPYWSPSLVKLGRIGAHIFYRWNGGGQARVMATDPEPQAAPEGIEAEGPPPATPSDAPPASVPTSVMERPIEPPSPRPTATSPPEPVAKVASASSEPSPFKLSATPAPAAEAPPPPVDPPYRAKPTRRSLDSPSFMERPGGL